MKTFTEDQSGNNVDYTLFPYVAQGGLKPLHVKNADGIFFYDDNKKKYIDFSSQYMNVNIGHGHPAVMNAVIDQMLSFSYMNPSFATDARGELGLELAKLLPRNLTKTFFTLGGSDAIDSAVQIARRYTGRSKIITMSRSYHGGTYSALSLSGDPRRLLAGDHTMRDVVRVNNPYFYRCPWGSKTFEECGTNCAANLETVIEAQGGETIAAIILEGESGTSGCIKYPPNFWKLVRGICDKYGILLVDDEVMSGFGRTGKMFAIEHHDVLPDIMCMAKGITSGYLPLGAVAVSEKISSFFDDHALPCGFTCSAHPVSCAAALAVLNVYKEEQLVENASKMGHYIYKKLEELSSIHPSIGDFRITGLLGCIELVKDRSTKEPITATIDGAHNMEVMNKIDSVFKELGLFTLLRWNLIFIAPPLCITKEQIDDAFEILSAGLSEADKYCNQLCLNLEH
ncbi:aminotransferase class III-fold pyridoxal phosphate-dependent enzyme [Mucilaginibacter sp. OK098]|uniref:aminotransferase class III-fold pyridoxal phosphate-dependent enzyme n=1 Tax=Mucilaginibacter sp. OK098 TaxID=1855297 RepID=UPI00090F9AF9|nr:aminotransferase class III-fold pyridoxal phosphate-dependent enzyme [Mucilaginibacter sp. OK098]SHN33779.1 taurine---2-oxoglutarate transaminase [Mucilaginibacter sp. OK098]